MAEYAGLEIRIGGNTTKLTNALKASTKSAAELQSRIRQATQAMQFDPNSLRNVDTRVKLTSDRMQSLQSKVQIARKAMDQLGDSIVKIGGREKSVREVVEQTENLSLAAKQADQRFAGLTDTLAKIYDAWNKMARSEGKDFAQKVCGIQPDTARQLMSTTTSLSAFKTKLEQINTARKQGLDERPIISDAELEKLTRFKELNFHDMFKRGLDLDDVIQDARDLGIVIEDSAISNVRKLQESFKDAQQEKKAFDDALKYDQLGTDIERFNAEIEGMSQTMRKLDDSLNPTVMSDDFQEIEARVRTLDAAIKNVDDDLARTGEAMKVDPTNVTVAARHFSDLNQKVALSQEKTELLQREMDMLNASGATEAAKGHQDLSKWIEESAEAARVAKKDLNEQRATVMNLEDEIKNLQQYIANMKGDTTLAAYSDHVASWQKKTQQLNGEMQKLKEAEDGVAAAQAKLGEAHGALDKANEKAKEYGEKLEWLKAEHEQLSLAYNETFVANDGLDDGTNGLMAMYERLQAIESEIKQVEIAYEAAEGAVKDFNKDLVDPENNLRRAQGVYDDQRAKVERLRDSIKELEKTSEVKIFRSPTDEIEKAKEELVGLQGELTEAKTKENELEAAYDSAKTENELAKTASAAQKVAGETEKAKIELKEASEALKPSAGSILNPSTIKTIGMTLSATVTPLVTALGYKMVDASSTIDSAYRDMRKTVEGTEEQFEALRQSAIDFSRTHVTSADQILEIQAIGGELGVATSDLEAFATAISNIDVATNLDTESAATVLGHLSNILHLTAEDYEGFSDALVRLGNNGASTETEIANIAERIGSMGAIVGMSASDVLAWASTIASTGQRAEAAGTAISKTMSFFETAVASAGGTIDATFESVNAAVDESGDKLTVFANMMGVSADEFAEMWETDSEAVFGELSANIEAAKGSLQSIADVAHMSADDFVQAWENDPTKVMQAFIQGLNDIEAAGGSADAVLQGFKITSVRQKQAIEGLMQTIDGLDNNLRMSEDAWKGISDQWGEAGDAANEAAKKAEGFSGQLQIMKNIGQNALAELGEGAAPWIKSLSGAIQSASEWFSALTVEQKKWIVFAGGMAAAIGPLLSIGATAMTSYDEFGEWVNKTVTGMEFVKRAFASGGQQAVDSLMETMTMMDKVKLVASNFGMSIVKGLALGLVVGGIALIVSKLVDLYRTYRDHERATKGLSDALLNVGSVSEFTASDIEMVGSSLRELASDSEDYESRLADLANTIEDSNRQYGTFAGQMDYYGSVIEELGGKTGLTGDEAYKLEAALMAVNDACGTTYGLDEYNNIIDTTTGKILEQNDVILANIEARKQQALIDYYSDDYAQAVNEWAAAQDKLNEAQEKYNTLTQNGGKEKYFENARSVYGSNYDEDKIAAAYEKEVSDAEKAMSNYRAEMSAAGDAMTKLDYKIADANRELNKNKDVLEQAAKAQEEFDKRNDTVAADVTGNMNRLSKAVDEIGGTNGGFNAMAEGLKAVHANADELNKVDMNRLAAAFSDAGGSMEQVISALEDGGVQMWTWNGALEQVPEAAERMSTLTASAFQSMYEQAGEDLEATMTLIAGLDEVKVGDKTFYIGDNGSIFDAEGKIYDIKNDLAEIPSEVITQYYVDDSDAAQTALDTKAQLEALGDEAPTPTVELNDKASEDAKTLQGDLNKLDATKAFPTANLDDYASAKLDSIQRKMWNLDGMHSTVTVTTNEKTTKQATGGMNNRPVIPRHAAGYIATKATLTNQGWIGEDGVEAVANWATGGAVVPLTNKKYMLPIADAIADGMTRRIGSAAPVSGGNTYVINGLTVAPDSALAKAMDATFDEAQRFTRMGRR